MKVIKRLFSNDPFTPAADLIQEYFSEIKFASVLDLPANYITLMAVLLQKCEKPHQFLEELLAQTKQYTGHEQVIKILTLVHTFLIERNYSRDDCRSLEEFQIGGIGKVTENEKWFAEFTRSYITYLVKVPSLSDVYTQLGKKEHNVEPALHLTHIFRIANTVQVLFPAITNAVNVIGRYQASKHSAMKQLFVVLSGELVRLYNYIRYLCEQILRQYRVYNPRDLRCFLQTLPQLELLCDKIEDLLVNKYLKGKRIGVKIEFRQQRVAEVQYYLEYEYNPIQPQQ